MVRVSRWDTENSKNIFGDEYEEGGRAVIAFTPKKGFSGLL